MAVIFDLDQTLVDSSCAESLRKALKWSEVYTAIEKYTVYDGVISLLDHLAKHGVPVCIVTSSHSTYCGKVLNHFKIDLKLRVCYHDTKLRKPNPDPIVLAISKLKADPKNVISIGDDPRDIIASKAAGAFSVAAMWGTVDRVALLTAKPDAVCETVDDLKKLLNDRLGLGCV